MAAQIDDAETALEAIANLVGFYRDQLINTDHRAGCPIVAVTVESDNADAGLHQHAATAFDRWRDALAGRLTQGGVDSDRAAAIALLAVASIEGALVLARAQHDPQPLDAIHLQLQDLIAQPPATTADRCTTAYVTKAPLRTARLSI